MSESITLRIVGVSPLLLHNGRLADPINPTSKAMKVISGKRDKTDADHEELSRLEFFGGLYLDNGKPCIPGEVIEAAFVSGAKKSKRGKLATAGVICPDNCILDFDGPKDLDERFAGGFVLRTGVKVGQARVMRTRPKFDGWSCKVTLVFDNKVLNRQDIIDILRTAGNDVGLCDWRPKFGRFTVEV